MAATNCVSMPNWFWKPAAKYVRAPRWSTPTYCTLRMWLNIWPDVKMRMEMSEAAAQTLRFWRMGRTYGHATKAPVPDPRTMVVVMAHLR